ncbi:MAG: aspartate aminotransferase family protein [Telmatospirillum sp.]|nr:aspartate aminotransferase family protein [Telmatospirillum sp.]
MSGSPHEGRETVYWQQLDRHHHWHPFTDTAALNAKGARVITRASGVYLWDTDGNRILDGMSGLWCVNLGYGRTELIEAASRQLAELPYYNAFFQTTTMPAASLAAEIAKVTPQGLDRVFFANSGSEAIDTAIRMVRTFWAVEGKPGKSWIIARQNAYHGSTIGALSVGGQKAQRQQGGPLVGDVAHVPQPFWYGEAGGMPAEDFGLERARAIERKILELGPDRVAAVFGEPVQGAGGVIVPPDSYWPEVVRICRKYDVLLVADEVICGFGRTGAWFGSETFGIEPDLMTMAKGLSSGYLPISAVAVGRRVADSLIEKAGEFCHGFTYSGHPVAAAVALKAISLMREENLVERVRDDIGPYFQQSLATLADHPLVGHIDGIGMLAGLSLVAGKKPDRPFAEPDRVGTLCRDHCFANGLVMRAVGGRMVLAPPLVISHAEVDELVRLARLSLDMTARDVGLADR